MNVLIRLSRPGIALVIVLALAGASLLGAYSRPIAPDRSILPIAATDYIIATDPSGRVYNDYSFGGYLILRGVKTFIDGRADQLFGGGFLAGTFESSIKSNDDFVNLIDKYNVTSALVLPKSGAAARLDKSPA